MTSIFQMGGSTTDLQSNQPYLPSLKLTANALQIPRVGSYDSFPSVARGLISSANMLVSEFQEVYLTMVPKNAGLEHVSWVSIRQISRGVSNRACCIYPG